MAVIQITGEEVLRGCREALGLPLSVNGLNDDAFLAASIRRGAGFLCPCGPATLVSTVMESLSHIAEDSADLASRLGSIVETLVVQGDLLELDQMALDGAPTKGASLFAAPPSFVQAAGGSVFLLGIGGDETTPLPASLNSRVLHDRCVRRLLPESSEDLASTLRGLGLIEIPLTHWLQAPKEVSAEELRESLSRRLLDQPPSGAIEEIFILDFQRDVDYYAKRWVNPSNETGTYVARRPQAYGAPLWGFASLVDGAVTRFLDLPLKGSPWRGCDSAWHLQMAIDSCSRASQHYRRREAGSARYLDFFSPLPIWAQRRLAVIGKPAPAEDCLLSYVVPERELASEEAFLQDRLWLSRRTPRVKGS